MGIKCPKCQSNNPDTQQYCGECGTQLIPSKEIPVTKTLEKPIQELIGGTTFAGRYQIIEELGRGGMGVVYKAQDTKLKRTVALKFLPPELTHISEVKERFMREAQAAAALDHPNICTVHEFDEAEEKTFISMAYIEGQSLKKKIESGPLVLDEALRIATQVAEGLQEAHDREVVHRDIKSANIMVDERGQAKIMDFGLARIAGGTLVTKEGMTMGTIAYMSPEQARGEEVDHRTDIWSLGVVLYEIFTGQLPFKGEHDQAVVYSILKEKPKPITDIKADIPTAIEQVVGKALEKNPDERYQHIDELIDDLKSISEGIVPEGVKARLRKAKLLRRKRAILYASIAGFLIIMTVIALSLFTGRAAAIDSIAVLPFENLTGDAGQEYFVDGVTDELIGQLAQIGALRVISRTSVMQYKGVKKSLPEIARELNVDAVVEGTVHQVGDSVRIRVELIDALPEERNLWAQTYDRDMTDVLVMYSEIARAIIDKTQVKLTQQEQTRLASARPVDPEAHEAYLRGNYFSNKASVEGWYRAIEYYEQAIEEDPRYAPPHAAMAYTLAILPYYLGRTRASAPQEEFYPKARDAARTAIELDDTLATAHIASGLIEFSYYWDWAVAEREFQRAIELEPGSAEAHLRYGAYLAWIGRSEDGIAEGRHAVELDLLSLQTNTRLGMILYFARRYDEAIEQLKKVLDMEPNFGQAYLWLFYTYMNKGLYEDAFATFQKVHDLWGSTMPITHRPWYAYLHALWGKKEEARRTLSAPGWTNFDPWIRAVVYGALGEKDEAFLLVEQAYKERDPLLAVAKEDPRLDPLRDDPRFQDLLRRMNFPE